MLCCASAALVIDAIAMRGGERDDDVDAAMSVDSALAMIVLYCRGYAAR